MKKFTFKNKFAVVFLLLGISSFLCNAQLYYSDGFENSDWKGKYDIGTGKQNLRYKANGGYKGSGGIEITVVKGSHYGGSIKYKLKENLGFEPEELFAEYRVKYDRSMRLYGGKGPGFDGTYENKGWGNRPGYGKDGWSARGTLKMQGRSNARNSFYVYHTDTGNNGKTWGDAVWWDDGGNMDFDKWYHVKQYVKLNTPGKKDGILRAWVNGKLVYERKNWNFRIVDKLKIYAYWFNYYNGGRDTADATGTVMIDDFKLYGPNGVSCTPGNACDDGNACTINDVIDSDCNCKGAPDKDTDNDGICDTLDQCPNLDDKLIGTACDDGDLCTFNDVYTSNCDCQGTPAQTITVQAIEDAFVQGGNGVNSDVLRIEDNNRIAYLKYNLSAIDNEITDVKLAITNKTDAGSGKINVYMSNNVNWTENNITSANAPKTDVLVGSIDGNYSENNTYDISLSKLPKTAAFSLILVQQSGNDAAFASSEFSDQSIRPVLKVGIKSDECNLSTDENVLKGQLKIYPNPVETILTIQRSITNLDLEINLFDTLGKKLIQINSNEDKNHLDLSKIASGIYLVSITDENTGATVFKKIIKK